MIDLIKSSMGELKAEFVRLADVVSTAEYERRLILGEMEARTRAAAAKVLLHELNADEISALKEELR